MHVMIVSLLLFAALLITAVLFVFWVLLVIIRGISRLFLGPGLKSRQASKGARQAPMRPCPQPSCKASNPVEARFCRRCGRRMDEPQQSPVRRVAML